MSCNSWTNSTLAAGSSFYLRANIRNNVVDWTLSSRFELYGEVPIICFSHRRQSKLQACAAGCGLHFRSRAQNFLNMSVDSIDQ